MEMKGKKGSDLFEHIDTIFFSLTITLKRVKYFCPPLFLLSSIQVMRDRFHNFKQSHFYIGTPNIKNKRSFKTRVSYLIFKAKYTWSFFKKVIIVFKKSFKS